MRHKGSTLFDDLSKAYGVIALVIAVVVALAATAAYIVSDRFREMVSPREFVVGVVGWALIALVVWWLNRSA